MHDLITGIFQTPVDAGKLSMLVTLFRAEAAEYQFRCQSLPFIALLITTAAPAERRAVLFRLLARVLLAADVWAGKNSVWLNPLLLVRRLLARAAVETR